MPTLQEETDELLLFDEELMDVDPEYLPRRLLTDFTIYNAEASCRALLPPSSAAATCKGMRCSLGWVRVACLASWPLASCVLGHRSSPNQP